MRKILALLLLAAFACTAYAFDLVLPEVGEVSYSLLDGDDVFTVDDSVFYKTAFDGAVLAERFSDTITLLSYGEHGDRQAIVMLSSPQSEVEMQLTSLTRSTNGPILIAVGTPLTMALVEELGPEEIFATGGLSNTVRAMLRREGIPFHEVSSGSILQISEDGVTVIDGTPQGRYITCPTCGTRIYQRTDKRTPSSSGWR